MVGQDGAQGPAEVECPSRCKLKVYDMPQVRRSKVRSTQACVRRDGCGATGRSRKPSALQCGKADGVADCLSLDMADLQRLLSRLARRRAKRLECLSTATRSMEGVLVMDDGHHCRQDTITGQRQVSTPCTIRARGAPLPPSYGSEGQGPTNASTAAAVRQFRHVWVVLQDQS
jgi:hypothetical protein